MVTVNKNKELQRMQAVALAVLSIAFIGYIIGIYFHIGMLKAFSEAAMVGGLADWFAVVALFRRPMGLPIPHTALIPNNKDRIGENLGKFVTDEFLTHERLEPKINKFDFAEKASLWLAEEANAHKISDLIIVEVIPAVLKAIKDEDVQRLLRKQLDNIIQSINLDELLGMGVDLLTKDGRHQELFTSILEKLHDEFRNYEDDIRAKVAKKTPSGTGWLLNKPIGDGFIDGIDEFLRVAKQPSSDVRKKLDHYIVNFVDELKSSHEKQEAIRTFINQLPHHQQVNEYINSIWIEIQTLVLNDIALNEKSKIRNSLANMFQNLGAELSYDEKLKHKINNSIRSVILEKLIEYKGTISNFIAFTVKSWDPQEVSKKLELEIGKDLQFIRLNGTLVGGLIGVALYFLSVLFK